MSLFALGRISFAGRRSTLTSSRRRHESSHIQFLRQVKILLRILILATLIVAMDAPARAEFKSPREGLGGWVRQIALGRFEIARGATRNEPEVISLQTKRAKLLAALYHDVYDGMCPITGPSRSFAQRIDVVTTTGTGREVGRTKGKTNTIKVRAEYVDVFGAGWALAASSADIVFTFGPNFAADMEQLAVVSRDTILANGCGTPGLELFERNLAALVRGEQSLQRRGVVTTHLESRCVATDLAGLGARAARPVGEVCACLAGHFWETLPETWLADVEDRFNREELLIAASLTPEAWNGARSCIR